MPNNYRAELDFLNRIRWQCERYVNLYDAEPLFNNRNSEIVAACDSIGCETLLAQKIVTDSIRDLTLYDNGEGSFSGEAEVIGLIQFTKNLIIKKIIGDD